MNSQVDVGPPAESPPESAVPAARESPSMSPPATPSPTKPRRARTPKAGGAARVVRTGTLFVIGAALAIYIAVWLLLFAVLTLGPLGLLVYATLLGAVLAVVAPSLLVRYRAEVRRPLAAIGRWIGDRVHAGAVVAQAPEGTSKEPVWQRLARLLGIHAVWNRTARAWVLLGLAVALALLWTFAVVLAQVVTGGSLTGTDLRVLNLVALLRTPTLDQAMYVLTYLGNVPVIVAVTASGIGIALLVRRYADALVILLAPIAGGLFVEIVKLIVDRPRPPLVDARIVATGSSFPSGHATVATVLYGTAAYLLLRYVSRWPTLLRATIAVVAALLIFGIGLSRIYLGVHYPSDVLAGWVAGAVWLVLVDVTGHIAQQASPASPLSPPRRVLAGVGTIILVAGASASLVAMYPPLPPPPTLPVAAPVVLAPSGVQAAVVTQLPHVTETIFGAPQEPINLVFVGTQAQLERAFAAAGWVEAERPEAGNDVRALWAGVTGGNDPAGPVAPSFLADAPNVLAFSQEVDHSFVQRHHVRMWSTADVTSGGQNVWLATASFDAGVGLSHDNLLPTHHIAPNIDAERGYLVTSLSATGDVSSTDTFQLVPRESGTNFVGDPFFTDGRAVLLVLQ